MTRFRPSRVASDCGTLFATAITISLLVACADDPASPGSSLDDAELRGVLLSNAHSAAVAQSGLTPEPTASATRVAYVSAVPGTFPEGEEVRIRNLTTGGAASSPRAIVDGGFDPIEVAAAPDDLLQLVIRQRGGVIVYANANVPTRRPPRVVRTNPPGGRTDVALSIQPTVVFSEPIDPQSLSATAVTLRRGGSPVSGRAALASTSSFTVVFTADEPLEPLTDYELVITTAIRDLDGESLPKEERVGFRTGPLTVGGGDLIVSNVTTGGAFDLDGYHVRIVSGEQLWIRDLELNRAVKVSGVGGAATVELEDVAENCSVTSKSTSGPTPDAAAGVEFRVACTPPLELASLRLVFMQWDTAFEVEKVTGLWPIHLWAMNADGTALQRLTSGSVSDMGPIPSSDGSRIAFMRDPQAGQGWGSWEVFTVDASGGTLTHLKCCAWPASWSPDGSLIALEDGANLDVVGADGSGFRTLLSHSPEWFAGSPQWSPDGRTIAYRRYYRPTGNSGCGRDEIWTMSSDGGSQAFVTSRVPCSLGRHLSWSRDGRILFADGTPSSLWAVNSDGSNKTLVVPPNPFGADFDDVSPDGRWIAFTRTNGRTDIYLVNVQDGRLVRVTADGASESAAFLP